MGVQGLNHLSEVDCHTIIIDRCGRKKWLPPNYLAHIVRHVSDDLARQNGHQNISALVNVRIADGFRRDGQRHDYRTIPNQVLEVSVRPALELHINIPTRTATHSGISNICLSVENVILSHLIETPIMPASSPELTVTVVLC